MSLITIKFAGGGKLGFDPAKGRTKSEKLNNISKKLKNMKPAMEHALLLCAKNEEELFATEGASVGQKWRPYTASELRYYLPYKRHMLGATHPMLRWSKSGGRAPAVGERLYPSLINRGAGAIARADKNGFEYGTTVSYAANHQYGRGSGWLGKYQLPQRTLLKLSRTTEQEIVRGMQAHIMGGAFTVPK